MTGIEQRIEENEERLRMAIESTHMGTWEYYPVIGKLDWSNECKKIYGLGEGQNIDFDGFADHIHPSDKEYVTAQIQRAMDPEGDGIYDITYRIIRFDDKTIRWIHPRGKAYFNEHGQVEKFIGTVVDITTAKTYEETLRESEQRVRIAVDAARMGTFDWIIDGNLFNCSARFREIFGFNADQPVSRDEALARFCKDDIPLHEAALQQAYQTNTLQYELRVCWPGGSVHWVKVHGRIILDPNMNIRRMYGIVMETTEQKIEESRLESMVAERTASLLQSNVELKKSEERYSKMAEEVKDYAILLLSVDGLVLNWNQGAERIKGYKESEIIGKHFRIFYLPDDRESKLPEALIKRASEEGRAMHEGWRIRKDNTVFWGSIVITALHDEHNNVIGFTKVTRDLTEKKLADDQLKQYAHELEEQNKELEQFAYIASHDLQEPLRKIQTFTEILERHIDEPEQRKKYLERIQSSAERMSQLIHSVLEYSRLSITDVKLEPVDLNIVIENVKTDLELQISEKAVIVDTGKLPVVKGIQMQLHQLFLNLISNAIKFSDQDPKIELAARLVRANELSQFPNVKPGMVYVEIMVRDNGIGFEQKYAEKIFTIFQRLHGQKTYPGTGIGLALCKKIVDNHHGYIRAESEPGKGSSFYVYLLPAKA
jgi:PAS domain S-box-containing protein